MIFTIETPQGKVEVTTFQDGRWWGASAGDERTDGWMTEERALKAIKWLFQLMDEMEELRNEVSN